MEAAEDSLADAFAQGFGEGVAAKICGVNFAGLWWWRVEWVVGGEQGCEAAVVAFGDDFVDDRELPFVVAAFAELVDCEYGDVHEGAHDGGFAAAEVELFAQCTQEVGEFYEFGGDAFFERQMASDGG